ncbi:hypothetical protein [Sphingomonas sp. R1]|uniref:hypothetical protein n=1 Tax=Sphingomonas sp. R1 TaxID=399176 RepID=UPI002224B6FF|nr:hypothetical protein [Sphingomonas sp. R1]UYY77518.1 hypothetical protein OIM94_00445 [Sphingomonas sp. R1]
MAFDPKNLIPAAQVSAFSKDAGQRSTKQVALDNIAKMRELFLDPKKEGKRNFKVADDRVAFTIRVNNTALVLEVANVQGTKVEVREMSAPKADFAAALDYYAERIRKDEYKSQLDALAGKREQRTSKMRQTRAAKKTDGAKS